jgi:hypothetical protein
MSHVRHSSQLRTAIPAKSSVIPRDLPNITHNWQLLNALVMEPQRLFGKKPPMMVLLAMFFPQACVAGRRRPESRRRNSNRREDWSSIAGEAFMPLALFH